jgi:hypothetical protein
MLSVGIAQHPVPDFRLTEEGVGRVRDSTSQASYQALLARCLKGFRWGNHNVESSRSS